MLDGESCRVELKGDKYSNDDSYDFPTRDLLILLAGAFEGLDEVIRRRLRTSRIGFRSDQADAAGIPLPPSGGVELVNKSTVVTKEDLAEYGFSPQLLGRIPTLLTLRPLSAADLLTILRTAEVSPLGPVYEYFFALQDHLEFEPGALEELAGLSAGDPAGARKLMENVDKLFAKIKFIAANKIRERIRISRAYVRRTLGAPTGKPRGAEGS